MTTIKDIAKLSGYSVSTVSRVLNNHPYVADDKRQKILAVIQELEYVPNGMARLLSLGKTGNIGVIVPFMNHPYFEQLVNGIVEAAFNQKYKVTLLPTGYDPIIEQKFLDEFSAKLFDGLIVTSRVCSVDTYLEYQQTNPIIFCENIASPEFGCAIIDREESFREVFSHLKNKGAKRVGVTLGRDENSSYSANKTLAVYQEYFGQIDEELIVRNCQTVEDGHRAGQHFEKQANLDAIFANGDEIAAGIKQMYPEKEVPLLIGQENLLISDVLHFSTIDHRLADCGRTAFDLFHRNSKEKIKIEHRFIQR